MSLVFKKKVTTFSPEQTLGLAREFAVQLKPGTVVALSGDLGSGKTLFSKGVISCLTGFSDISITSPTFTLVEEYPKNIFHVDLYRLESPNFPEDLPWDSMLASEAITLIEWPEKIEGLLEYCQIHLRFFGIAPEVREIHFFEKDIGSYDL